MYPNVLQKLRQEILDRVGSQRRPNFDDLREMKYLRAIINGMFARENVQVPVSWPLCTETLRLFPPVPL